MSTAPRQEEEDDEDCLFFSEKIIIPVTIVFASDEVDDDDDDDDEEDFDNQGARDRRSNTPELQSTPGAACRKPSRDGEEEEEEEEEEEASADDDVDEDDDDDDDDDPPRTGEGGVKPPPSHTRKSPPRSSPDDRTPHAGKVVSVPTAKSEERSAPKPCAQLLTCAECRYATGSAYNLSCHARTHTGERPYPCPRCARRCRTRSSLNRHMRSIACLGRARTPVRPASPRVWRCGDCDYSATNGYNMKVHRRVHSDERPYGCAGCGLRFRTQSHLYRHERCHCKQGECKPKIPGPAEPGLSS